MTHHDDAAAEGHERFLEAFLFVHGVVELLEELFVLLLAVLSKEP
jgi:hypothetical protein